MDGLTHTLESGTVIPYAWDAYPYQQAALARYFGTDGAPAQRRQIHVWSRRLGKDRFGLELAALASQRRVMNIWHLFPMHKQARIAIWNGIDPETGARFLDQTFPPDMVARRSDAQMMLDFYNGSTYQMIGSDNYNSVVGSNPGLVIFSEFALSDPLAWTYISPIIRQNDGGAIFISTYRGKNHHYKLVQLVKSDPEWFVSFENVDTAKKNDGTAVYPREKAEKELVHMDLARWREEYLNVPCVALEGAYFAKELSDADEFGRNGVAKLRDTSPLACAWGYAHSHHVWCVVFQLVNGAVHVVGAMHWQFVDPVAAMRELESLEGMIECHILPAASSQGVPGETTEEKFESCIAGNVYLAEPFDVHASIDGVRRLLPSVKFSDEDGAPDFFEALTEFRSGGGRVDEDHLSVATRPVNDSGSVAALAMMAVADFRASGVPIARKACALDWQQRNIRRQLA
jgi:phage terminase large subunit